MGVGERKEMEKSQTGWRIEDARRLSCCSPFLPFPPRPAFPALPALPAFPVLAQGRGGQPPSQPHNRPRRRRNRNRGVTKDFGPAEEKVSTTSHVVRLDGREIKNTATVGTIPIRLDNGQVSARMFFVVYAKDGEDVKTRPVSFLYNGGPGAATIWLHMGSFAPKHVRMAERRVPARAAVPAGGQREPRSSMSAIRCSSTRSRHGVQPHRRRA